VLIAGDGPLRQKLEHRVTAPVFEGRVRVIGEIDDARHFYGQCDIFVVPSVRSEGLPTTILEAMASSCAVVATDIGGAGEAIESGRSGIIVPPADPIALADAIQQIIQDAAFRKQIQQNAAKHVLKEFDKEKMIDRICQVLSNAIAANTRTGAKGRDLQCRQ
jgi:glycosyltransferase involved in cell wall biosynthesis